MKNLLLISTLMFSISVSANIGGVVSLNSDHSEATLNLTETNGNGELSQLFDQMNLIWTGSGNHKTKSFTLKNGRFGFICNKGYFESNEPWTTCTFFVKQGENKKEASTFIAKIDERSIATIATSPDVSNELEGIFPTDAYNSISYALRLANNVHFDVQGTASSGLTIEFSAR